MTTVRSVLAVALLLVAGCAPLTPEERLQRDVMLDVFWDAARECRNRYLNILLDRVQLNGDLSVSAVAESRFDKAPFIQCYHDAIRRRVDLRRRAGLGVPERINLTPDVDFD